MSSAGLYCWCAGRGLPIMKAAINVAIAFTEVRGDTTLNRGIHQKYSRVSPGSLHQGGGDGAGRVFDPAQAQRVLICACGTA